MWYVWCWTLSSASHVSRSIVIVILRFSSIASSWKISVHMQYWQAYWVKWLGSDRCVVCHAQSLDNVYGLVFWHLFSSTSPPIHFCSKFFICLTWNIKWFFDSLDVFICKTIQLFRHQILCCVSRRLLQRALVHFADQMVNECVEKCTFPVNRSAIC